MLDQSLLAATRSSVYLSGRPNRPRCKWLFLLFIKLLSGFRTNSKSFSPLAAFTQFPGRPTTHKYAAQQRHRSGQSRHSGNHRSNGNASSANGSNIPLQPTAPPLNQYQPAVYQQTQLTVALPPESTITFTPASSNRVNEPPPPYTHSTANHNGQIAPSLPPRPSSLATQNLLQTTNSTNLHAGGSVNSCSSTNSSNNLLPIKNQFGQGRGYYNRKQQQNNNVPTSKSQSVSSSASSKHSSGKQSSSSSSSKKSGKK